MPKDILVAFAPNCFLSRTFHILEEMARRNEGAGYPVPKMEFGNA